VLYENGNIRTVQFGYKSTISRPTICTIGFFFPKKSLKVLAQLSTRTIRPVTKPNDCGQGDLRLTREGRRG